MASPLSEVDIRGAIPLASALSWHTYRSLTLSCARAGRTNYVNSRKDLSMKQRRACLLVALFLVWRRSNSASWSRGEDQGHRRHLHLDDAFRMRQGPRQLGESAESPCSKRALRTCACDFLTCCLCFSADGCCSRLAFFPRWASWWPTSIS